MTIDLKEPRNGRIKSVAAREETKPSVDDRTGEVPMPPGESYYFIVKFPPLPPYEEPDTDQDVSHDDLRAIARRHAVDEDSIEPDPGWPEGWH
jgi:hypothetical protein